MIRSAQSVETSGLCSLILNKHLLPSETSRRMFSHVDPDFSLLGYHSNTEREKPGEML